MTLRLDPRIPLLWRDPTTVQFGVDDPLAVLDGIGTAEEAMLAAMAIGVSESGLELIARELGAPSTAAAGLAERVRPVLARDEPASMPRVLVHGVGALADRIAETLEGVRVLRSRELRAASSAECDLAIVAVDWVVPTELMGLWLRRDVPHLAVVASDTSVTVGPLVEPGRGPCLYCRHRTLADDDPAWPRLAIQLAGFRPAHPGRAVAAEAAALAARLAQSRAHGTDAPPRSTTIDALTGTRSERAWSRHPECACGDVVTAPAESGSAVAVPLELPRRRTTTATPIAALA